MPAISPQTQRVTPDSQADRGLIYIARQPVFDATEKVVAYQFLIRESGMLPETTPDSIKNSATLITNAFNYFGLHKLLGDKQAFIPVSADTLMSDFLDLLPKENVVLEFHPTDVVAEELAEQCVKLAHAGFRLAVNIPPAAPGMDALLASAHYAIFDIGNSTPDTNAQQSALARQYPAVKRLARNIHTRNEFLACKEQGFDLYQGQYFAIPETLAMNRLNPSAMRVMQLFNMVINRADIHAIEAAFKHDVALCYCLMCYINSAGVGLPYKTESIRSAIMLLGYDFLWRWLSLLIFAGVDLAAGQRVLLNTALIRGRLTELLGQSLLSEKESNHLFIVGVFSLLDALLGMPMEQALANLNLPDEAARALLQQEGKYAPFLALAKAFEGDNLFQAEKLSEELGIDLSDASQAHLTAIEWAAQFA